ncbi:MAG: hypothetical protein IK016_06510 [Lachnospiraceae bacterium]|nr:hypothetical protein [Lachnospiraceae bacterium]
MLQKSYSGYEKKFKESKRTIKEAIDFLVRLGAVVREFRDVKTIGDGILRNVMYLSAVPEVIMELTYPEEETTSGHGDQKSDDEQTETHVIYRGVEEDEIRESLADTGVEVSDDDTEGGSYKKTYDVVQKNVPPPTEKRTTSYTEKHHLLQRDVPHGTEIRGTNTENTTETTNGDYNNQIRQSSAAADEATEPTGSITETEAYIRLIKKNLEYDIMRERYTGADRELYETIFRVICHVVCGKGNKKHRIGDLEFPHETVKSVFMKLNQTHIGIVMEGYQDTATKVTDMGAYLTAALYNAYVTGNLYWDRRVKYDMYGGGWEEQGITTTRTEENNG